MQSNGKSPSALRKPASVPGGHQRRDGGFGIPEGVDFRTSPSW